MGEWKIPGMEAAAGATPNIGLGTLEDADGAVEEGANCPVGGGGCAVGPGAEDGCGHWCG